MKRAMSWLLVLAMLFTLAASFAEQAEDAEALPETFDLRSVDTDGDGIGDRCYVPPVRQQNPFGTCWGFSATAASEISILGSILDYDPDAWKTIDLSEKQLAYFTHVPLADENNPQNGEGIYTDGKDAVSIYNTGGNSFLAASAYAQGIGSGRRTRTGRHTAIFSGTMAGKRTPFSISSTVHTAISATAIRMTGPFRRNTALPGIITCRNPSCCQALPGNLRWRRMYISRRSTG